MDRLHLLLGTDNCLYIALIDNASNVLDKHLGRRIILIALEVAELAFGRSVWQVPRRLHRFVYVTHFERV